MDPAIRFQRIEALLHAMAERDNEMEIRFNKRMDRIEAAHAAALKRMEAAERRMDLRGGNGNGRR